MAVSEPELVRLRQRFHGATGKAATNFVCPILWEEGDGPRGLMHGHILNEAIREASRKKVVQRADVDNLFGCSIDADQRPWYARKDEPKPRAPAAAPVAAPKSQWPGGLNPVQRSLERSTLVKMERGTFSQTFKKAGMVHVQDMATNRILTSRGVDAGDQLTLNVRESQLHVNKNVTLNLPKMDAGHVHAFRFDEKGRHAWDEYLQGIEQQEQARRDAAAAAPKPQQRKAARPDAAGTPTRHTSARD